MKGLNLTYRLTNDYHQQMLRNVIVLVKYIQSPL